MKWHYTKDKDRPQRTAPCVVYKDGVYRCLRWSFCNGGQWDSSGGYDYVCDFQDIERWAYIEDEQDNETT